LGKLHTAAEAFQAERFVAGDRHTDVVEDVERPVDLLFELCEPVPGRIHGQPPSRLAISANNSATPAPPSAPPAIAAAMSFLVRASDSASTSSRSSLRTNSFHRYRNAVLRSSVTSAPGRECSVRRPSS